AEHVADRVHAERRVLVQEDPQEAAPNHPLETRLPRAAHGVADREWDPERDEDPEQIEAVDRPAEAAVVEGAPGLAASLHSPQREEPADVRVDEPLQRAEDSVAVAYVRRVRVTLLVREGVMLAVVGHPLGQRALHGHAAEDRERRLDRRSRLEAAMREVAVEADRDPERADEVHRDEQHEVDRVEADTPEQAHRRQEADGRDDDGDHGHDLARSAGPAAHRRDALRGFEYLVHRPGSVWARPPGQPFQPFDLRWTGYSPREVVLIARLSARPEALE